MTQGSVTPRIVCALSLWLAVAIAVSAQTQRPYGGQAGLQKVDAPDGSASAGLPKGWRVIKSGQMVIDAVGPQGEAAQLGNTAVVRDPSGPPAAARLGGVDMEMPYATPLPEKFVRIVRHVDPANQVSINNSTEFKVAPQMGQCARIVGDITTKDGVPKKFESLFCSLPPDVARIYKNVFRLVMAPAQVAAQEGPMLEAVLTSYRVPPQMLQRMLAPVVGPAPGAGGRGPDGGPGGPGGGPSGPGGPGGGAASMNAIQAKAAAQMNEETKARAAGALQSAEGEDSILRQ
jgi:hypothetical protein